MDWEDAAQKIKYCTKIYNFETSEFLETMTRRLLKVRVTVRNENLRTNIVTSQSGSAENIEERVVPTLI